MDSSNTTYRGAICAASASVFKSPVLVVLSLRHRGRTSMWQFDVQPSSFVGQAEADDVQSAGVAMASCDFVEFVVVAKERSWQHGCAGKALA